MPNLRLCDQEISDVIAFLSWVGEIDTNGWPPTPRMEVITPVSPGDAIFKNTYLQRIMGIEYLTVQGFMKLWRWTLWISGWGFALGITVYLRDLLSLRTRETSEKE